MNRLRNADIWLLVLCMIIAAGIRTLPLRLDGVRQQATEQARTQIAENIGAADAGTLDRWRAEHPGEYARMVEAREADLKADLSFSAEDGREHPYLGDYDSYLWLHQARNYLRTGTVCGEVVDGVCRDRMSHAPVGGEMLYARSLHTAAIVVLHKGITLFSPGFPLSSTAFFIPVIVGVLGIIPAFFLGRRFGGTAAAVTAALATALNPALLIRTIGSDNDIWNVVIPLYVVWAGVEALAAETRRGRLLWAAMAGVGVGAHAAAWSGWLLSYGILVVGIGATLGLALVRSCIQTRSLQPWLDPSVQHVVAVLFVYVLAAGAAVTVANPEADFIRANERVVSSTIGGFTTPTTGSFNAENAVWPRQFSAVAELRRLESGRVSRFTTNVPFLFGAFWGLVLLVLGRRPWGWQHWTVLGLSLVPIGYAYVSPSMGPSTAGWLVFVPAAAALALVLNRDRRADDLERGALVIVLWLGIAYQLGTEANRFVMFLAAPVGIVAGVVAGWLQRAAVEALEPRAGHRVATAVGLVAVAAVLAGPLSRGYATAQATVPKMNDAWWDTFRQIRDTAPPEAIVNLWWHDGHWAKYAAERPVIADGASLRTHIPFWFTRALLAEDDARAAAILRMLDCGSDALPYPEGALGAYGKLRAEGLSVIAAQALVEELVDRSRADANELLVRRGVSPSAAASVLESTHCQPPPMYLVLGDDLATTAGWRNGLWDFRRAYILESAHVLWREEALREYVGELGYTAGEARKLYRAARKLKSGAERQRFVAPELGFLTPAWVSCATDGGGSIQVCPLASNVAGGAQVVDAFEYSQTSPTAGRLRIRTSQPGSKPKYSYRTPGTIFLAQRHDFRRVNVTRATDPGLAVLIDLAGARILMAEAALLASTFTKLVFLDGRYVSHFEKLSDRESATGRRVVSYRVLP